MTKPDDPVLPDGRPDVRAPSAPVRPPASRPEDATPDLGESVVGEEDPGASLDLGVGVPPSPPARP